MFQLQIFSDIKGYLPRCGSCEEDDLNCPETSTQFTSRQSPFKLCAYDDSMTFDIINAE
jgi:hypothetical protein